MKIDQMPSPMLEQQRDELLAEINKIKGQLDRAKSKALTKQGKPDRNWMDSARHALRMKNAEYQAVLRELGQRKKAARRQANNTAERAFVEVARRRLDGEVFREMWDEANEMADSAQGE